MLIPGAGGIKPFAYVYTVSNTTWPVGPGLPYGTEPSVSGTPRGKEDGPWAGAGQVNAMNSCHAKLAAS